MKKTTVPTTDAITVINKAQKKTTKDELIEIEDNRQVENAKHISKIKRLDNLIESVKHPGLWIRVGAVSAILYVVCQILSQGDISLASSAKIIKEDIEFTAGYVVCALGTYVLTSLFHASQKSS
jgi:hypothetical protein